MVYKHLYNFMGLLTLFLYARLKNGTYYAVAMSVRPSVRPRFPDFSSTKIILRILAIIFVRFGFFEVFRAFFYMFWDISFKLGIYMQ